MNNLTIDNTNGVTLSKATTVDGILNLQAGVFGNSGYAVTLGPGGSEQSEGGSLKVLPVEMTSFTATYKRPTLCWHGQPPQKSITLALTSNAERL